MFVSNAMGLKKQLGWDSSKQGNRVRLVLLRCGSADIIGLIANLSLAQAIQCHCDFNVARCCELLQQLA